MGWVKKDNGGYGYHYVLNGPKSDHTLPANSEAVPVCVVVAHQPSYLVYDANGNKARRGGWYTTYHNDSSWKVINARVQLVRYYAASTAKVTLAIDLPNGNSKIPPPGLDWDTKYAPENANNYSIDDANDTTRELRPEMDIEIYMGYLSKFESIGDYLRGVDVSEETGSTVFQTNSSNNSTTVRASQKLVPDPTRFTKVFTGVIDTVDLKLGRGDNPLDGVTCTISARDKMRFLIDNKFFGQLTIPGANFAARSGVPRTNIVRAMIEDGSAKAVKVADDGNLLFHPSGRPPMVISTIYDLKIADKPDSTPVVVNGNVPFSIPDQFPVDVIRWFSLIETMPRELFCDQETGKIAWTVRMLGEPYKTLGSAFLMKTLDAVMPANNNVDDLWKAIRDWNNNNRNANTKIDQALATKYMALILGQQTNLPSQLRRILDPVTFCAHIAKESGWDPGVETNTYWAAGLAQIQVKDGRTVMRDGSFVPRPQPNNGWMTEKDAQDPEKAIVKSFNILVNCFTREGKRRRSIQYWYEQKYLSEDDAQGLIYTAYNAGLEDSDSPNSDEGYVLGALQAVIDAQTAKVGPGKKFKVTAEQVINHIIAYRKRTLASKLVAWDAKAITEVRGHWLGIPEKGVVGIRTLRTQSPWGPFYKGLSEAGAAVDQRIEMGHGIAVLRGTGGSGTPEDRPWVLTYKLEATTKYSGTVKPNVLSAHASWSTLGVITRFTLLNPVVQNSSTAGVGNLRGTHSLFGVRDPGIPGYPMTHVFRTTAHLPDTVATSGRVSHELSSLTYEAGTRDKPPTPENPGDSNPKVSQADMSMPIKFASKIRYPVRNRYVWDETADSRMTDTVVDLVLNAMLCVHGQDIHAADFLIPLNPDMRPGHVAELHNMGFFNGEQMRIEGVIHMFAAGGVHNGCTTMGVAVSTQGSYDPLGIPGSLKAILALQKSAVDVATSPLSGASLKDKDNTDVDDPQPLNWNKLLEGPLVSQLTKDLKALNVYINQHFAKFLQEHIYGNPQELQNWINAHAGIIKDVRGISPRVAALVTELPPVQKHGPKRTRVENNILDHAFTYLAAGLGMLEIDKNNPPGYKEADGIDLVRTSASIKSLEENVRWLGLKTVGILHGERSALVSLGVEDPAAVTGSSSGAYWRDTLAVATRLSKMSALEAQLEADPGFQAALSENQPTMARRSAMGFPAVSFGFRAIPVFQDGNSPLPKGVANPHVDLLGNIKVADPNNLDNYRTPAGMVADLKSGDYVFRAADGERTVLREFSATSLEDDAEYGSYITMKSTPTESSTLDLPMRYAWLVRQRSYMYAELKRPEVTKEANQTIHDRIIAVIAAVSNLIKEYENQLPANYQKRLKVAEANRTKRRKNKVSLAPTDQRGPALG